MMMIARTLYLCICLWVGWTAFAHSQIDCQVVDMQRFELPEGASRLGQVKAGAHSFSSRCTRPQVLADLKSEACALGADAIVIVEEKVPGLWRSCFTLAAEAYAFSGGSAQAQLSAAELEVSARRGDTHSQYLLGMKYFEGAEGRVDLVQAYVWLNLAASQNYQQAVAARNRLEERLTPSSLAEAQQVSVQIWQSYYRLGAHRGGD